MHKCRIKLPVAAESAHASDYVWRMVSHRIVTIIEVMSEKLARNVTKQIKRAWTLFRRYIVSTDRRGTIHFYKPMERESYTYTFSKPVTGSDPWSLLEFRYCSFGLHQIRLLYHIAMARPGVTYAQLQSLLWHVPINRQQRQIPLTGSQRAAASRSMRRLFQLGLIRKVRDEKGKTFRLTTRGAGLVGVLIRKWRVWPKYEKGFINQRNDLVKR
jgi:DNA-binding MarR family transcriptional regulator